MDLRNFLFSYRSFTPVPLVLSLLYFANPEMPFLFYGLSLAVIGECIRINAIRYAGGATRTTKVGAPSLCTSGPYARTRNPLYLQNFLQSFFHLSIFYDYLIGRRNPNWSIWR